MPTSFRRWVSGRPLTVALLTGSFVLTALTHFGERHELLRLFTIADFERTARVMVWNRYQNLANLELWRLLTPIFLHFSFLHLAFNSVILLEFGSAIERFQGSLRYAGLIVWSAVLSNLAQLHFGGGPNFGGMSGVVYALVGYLWARRRADPHSPIGAPPQLFAFFVIWLVLGFSGALDSVFGRLANYAHLGGLLAGALFGYVAGFRGRRSLHTHVLR